MILEKEEIMDLSHKTLDYAMSLDIDSAEVFSNYIETIQIMTEGRSIANEREKRELGFAIRVLKGDSEGLTYTNKFDLPSLKKSVEEAVGIAKVAPANPGIRLPSPSKYKEISGIYSSSIDNIPIEKMIEYAKEVLNPMGEVSVDIQTNLSNIDKEEEWIGIVNSLGVEGFEKSNHITGGFFVVPRDGAKVGSFVFDSIFTRNPESVDFRAFGEELTQRAIRNLDAKSPSKIDSDIVIFKKDAVLQPIAMVIGMAVAANNVLQNRSMWKDKLADSVALESFNFEDRPHDISSGSGARSFDSEGTSTQHTTIIKDGILENFIFDELRASKMNAVSTGNCWRSLSGTPFMNPPSTIFPNAPTIQSGDHSFDEMIEDTKLGIAFEYFSGSFRIENGIFSGVAKGAQLIRNGEIAEPLINVSIGSNVFELLFNIEAMTKETYLTNNFLTTPIIKAKDVNISTQK